MAALTAKRIGVRSMASGETTYDPIVMEAALRAADQAAQEPNRLKRRDLEQEAVRLWNAARKRVTR